MRRFGRRSDPAAERERAIEQARRRREELSRQAAALRGKLSEPRAELERALYVVEELHPSIRRGLALADRARRAGDEPEARSFEETAGFLAGSLGATLVSAREAKILYDTALRSVEAAERAAEEAGGGIDEDASLPRPEDTRPADREPVERVPEDIEDVDARYERAVHEAEAACAAIRRRLAPPGGDDRPAGSPAPPGS